MVGELATSTGGLWQPVDSGAGWMVKQDGAGSVGEWDS